MNEIISILGVVILAGVSVYLLLIIFGYIKGNMFAAQYQQAELDNLNERMRGVIIAAGGANLGSNISAWQGTRKFEIIGKVLEAESTCSFYLAPHDGQPLPQFYPGQFLTFTLDIPGCSQEVVRCYSLSDAPTSDKYYRVTIKRIPPPRDNPSAPPGLSSSYFHDHLHEGSFLDVSAPAGEFYLDTETQRPVVLIGGGVGLTPVLSMLNHIIDTGSRRETWFYYGLRNGREHAFRDHLKSAGQYDNIHTRICYSDPDESDVLGIDYDVHGRITLDLLKKDLWVNNFDFYICGPPPLMNSMNEGLQEWGVPEEHIHYEAFGPASAKKAVPADFEPVEVIFSRSDVTAMWDGSHASLLELAQANNVPIDCSCKVGNCGQCKTALRSGNIKYFNRVNKKLLEKGTCLVCSSAPDGPITLDA